MFMFRYFFINPNKILFSFLFKLREFTLVSSLEKEGAFNNVENEAISDSLDDANTEPIFAILIKETLKNRKIQAELKQGEKDRN